MPTKKVQADNNWQNVCSYHRALTLASNRFKTDREVDFVRLYEKKCLQYYGGFRRPTDHIVEVLYKKMLEVTND